MAARRVLLAGVEGLAALAVGMVTGLILFEESLTTFADLVAGHLSGTYAVSAAAAALMAAPLLAGVTRWAGRWGWPGSG